MPKQLVFNDDARTRLKRGTDKLVHAVATTLGPKGRNAALGKPWGAPDGIECAHAQAGSVCGSGRGGDYRYGFAGCTPKAQRTDM